MTVSFRKHSAALCILGLLSTSALAGPPFRTDDPEPVEYQHWELNLFSFGTHIPGATVGVLPGLEANYGAAPNLHGYLVCVADGQATIKATRFKLASDTILF